MANPTSAGLGVVSNPNPAEGSRHTTLEPHPLDELERIVAEAQFRGIASEAELRDQITRNPYKHGVRALRAVLDLPGGPGRTRSRGERQIRTDPDGVVARLLAALGRDSRFHER